MIEHDHHNAEFHHHHSHAAVSRHPAHHHLLQVEDLSVSFAMYDEGGEGGRRRLFVPKRTVEVIRNLTISVHAGEMVAVVGASGSGKTLLADSIFALFEPNSLVTGNIWFDGEPQDAQSLARLRGCEIAFVPQSVAALDPLMKVGKQVRGFARSKAERAEARARQRELFERYELGRAVEEMYPHELSGGMARRVLLCMALMGRPRLIVADEPTPGLDLKLALQALDDLRSFARSGGGVMLITHDLELALQVADRIAVFKDGTVVEETDVVSFASPALLRHPFSRALWHAMPEHGLSIDAEECFVDVDVAGACEDGGVKAEEESC